MYVEYIFPDNGVTSIFLVMKFPHWSGIITTKRKVIFDKEFCPIVMARGVHHHYSGQHNMKPNMTE